MLSFPLIIYPHLSLQHILPRCYSRACATHKNLVYDLAHHESLTAQCSQWLERPTAHAIVTRAPTFSRALCRRCNYSELWLVHWVVTVLCDWPKQLLWYLEGHGFDSRWGLRQVFWVIWPENASSFISYCILLVKSFIGRRTYEGEGEERGYQWEGEKDRWWMKGRLGEDRDGRLGGGGDSHV